MDADFVASDPRYVTDTATYDRPRQFPAGIPSVTVTGECAVCDDELTGVTPATAVPR